MDRKAAVDMLRGLLNKYGLKDWGVRLNQNSDSRFLGLCSYRDKCIILSAHHIDIHSTPDVCNTIRHEVAHALVGPGHGHDDVWAAKAREVGCDNTLPCSTLSLTPEVIDAIRSGSNVEVTFDEHVVRVPKYTITRLQDKCKMCGAVAKMKSEKIVETPGDTNPNLKFIVLECGHMDVKKIPKGTPFHTFQMGGDPKCKHDWAKNQCKKCGRFRPYQFQLDGMAFLEAGLSANSGCGCFDEMGLGKTIQAGGVIFFHPEWWSTLWIVKSALKYQTAKFLVNWLGDSHVPQIINSSKDWLIPSYNPKTKTGIKHYIIGYDMLVHKTRTLKSGKVATQGFDINQFNRPDINIRLVVLDECQQIKNADSSRTQQVRRVVKGRKVLPLSGTPWNNRGSELFPVFNMMDPSKFYSADKFKRDWVSTYFHGNILKEGGIRNIPLFKEYTKDLCIRRERNEVLKELPLTNRTKLVVKLDAASEVAYDEAVKAFVEWFESQQQSLSGQSIIAAMSRLRHIVALAKIPTTMEYVREFVEETDRKLVVFAHHQDVQDLLYEQIKEEFSGTGEDRMPVFQFVGGMNSEKIHNMQTEFNAAPRAIMVASQLAAGEGLNLQTCSDCVMHERQWNPGREEQCESRFIRIGAIAKYVNSVYAHMDSLTAIDYQLDAIVARKRIQFNDWTGAKKIEWSEDSIMKELAQAIVNAYKQKTGVKKTA